ncbi:unnamed protein product [Gadus morhua 'NCC']
MASRKATFMDSHFNPTWVKGSNGGDDMASNTRGRSHAGALRVLGGRSRRTPLRKRDTDPGPEWLMGRTGTITDGPVLFLGHEGRCRCSIIIFIYFVPVFSHGT